MLDIDCILDILGILWETSKDIPFSLQVLYIGLEWNLETRAVRLLDKKDAKYIQAIEAWGANKQHTLNKGKKTVWTTPPLLPCYSPR